MKFSCELSGRILSGKFGSREFFSTDFFSYRDQKISKLPAVKIYFSDAPFYSLNVFERQWVSVALWNSSCPIGWFQTFLYERSLYTEMSLYDGKSDFIGKLKRLPIVRIKIPGHLNYCIDHMLRC